MTKQQTKKSRIKMGLPLLLLCVGALFFMYPITEYGFAQENEQDGNLTVVGDSIYVTGVANTVEYLTSLYLYVDQPDAATSVILKYDPSLNALLINSSINANALGIGYNNFGEGVYGSVFIGGSGNTIKQRREENTNDYGDVVGYKNSGKDNNIAIGGEKNNPGTWGGSAIVGGRSNTIGFGNSLMVGSENSSVAGHNSVALGAKKSSLNVQDWGSVLIGTNNHGDKHTFLLGSGINTHGGSHWSAAQGEVFVWSDTDEGLALLGGNLGGHKGFYVNAKNGLGLNTSTPRVSFDAKSAGPLRLMKTYGVQNGVMSFQKNGNGKDGVICNEDSERAQGLYRGVLAYAETDFGAGFCGCDGKLWKPMSTDPVLQQVCTEQVVDSRVCLGGENFEHVVFDNNSLGMPRWDEAGDDGNGEWVHLDWTFMGVPSLIPGASRECSYSCAVGYHPNEKSPKGWFTGDCVACTGLENGEYTTPGTGVNDCDFVCNGGFKYNRWAEDKKDRCSSCNLGEWSYPRNLTLDCDKCEVPKGISAKSDKMNAGIVFTDGVMWNGTAGTGEPYFKGFTSTASGNKYGCNYDCAPGYMYSFAGTEAGNICTECGIGTYSPGGNYAGEEGGTCASCTNMDSKSITFSWKDFNGIKHTHTISAEDVSWYTTKGKGINNCEWTCNPIIGLVKSGKSCKCPDGSHLELVGEQPRCISNTSEIECKGGPLGSTALKGLSYKKIGGTLSKNNWVWSTDSAKWTYVNKKSSELGECEWTCPQDYTQNGTKCKAPTYGKCGSKNGTLVDSLDTSDLCSSELGYDKSTYKKIEINYFGDDNNFQFFPLNTIKTNKAKYLITWTCLGQDNKPEYSASCYAYEKGTLKDGVCPNNSRDAGGNAKEKCDTDFSVCNKNLGCPTIQNIADTNLLTFDYFKNDGIHGKKWSCPGVFGGTAVNCHSCDEGYSWSESRKGCTKTDITIDCINPPSSWKNTDRGESSYASTFNEEKDQYIPGQKSWERLSPDHSSKLEPCEYKCRSKYHWYDGECVPDPQPGTMCNIGGEQGKPTTKEQKCAIGTPSDVYLDGDDYKFKWTCTNGSKKISCAVQSFSCKTSCPSYTTAEGKRNGYDSEPGGNNLFDNGTNVIGETCPCVTDSNHHVLSRAIYANPKCGDDNGSTNGAHSNLCKVGKKSSGVSYDDAGTTFEWSCNNGSSSYDVDCSSTCPDNYHISGGSCYKNPSCGTSNGSTNGNLLYLCSYGSTAVNGSYSNGNRTYSWSCRNGSSSMDVDCSSSCPEGFHIRSGGGCEEDPVDGECNYSTAGCTAGDYKYRDSIKINNKTVGKARSCLGKGTGKDADCQAHWECGGSCSANHNGSYCDAAYGSSTPSGKTACESARACTETDGHGKVTNVWPCTTAGAYCFNWTSEAVCYGGGCDGIFSLKPSCS